MYTEDFARGISADQQPELDKALARLEADILFMPGSQDRTTIYIDDLKLLMRAAKDAAESRELYEAIIPMEGELCELGRLDAVAPGASKVIDRYSELHPDTL